MANPSGLLPLSNTGLRAPSPEPRTRGPRPSDSIRIRLVTFTRRARRYTTSTATVAALAIALWTLARVDGSAPPQPSSSSFASTIASLSERGGYFDTDNLISNERSYLQVVSELRRQSVRGGAYIGVGPDQNFSYISEVRPTVAFIIDVRRDNQLLHLLFKALFAVSETRIEYLAQLTGRPVPPALNGWRQAPIDRLIGYLDKTAVSAEAIDARKRRIEEALRKTGVPLSAEDFATIAAFHRRFMDEGLSLRFNSTGRPPQPYYPTYRDLLLETDAAGKQANFLASEDSYQFVKTLQAQDRVLPVVGDISGPSALQAVGRAIAARGERLSAFYVSNVEYYLFSQGAYPRFVTNLRAIPRTRSAVLIRSVFGRYSGLGRPGDASQSQLHPLDDLLGGYDDGRYRSYGQLVGR